MNKKVLINLLKNGYTTSKKGIDEICKGFWELKSLFEDKYGLIQAKHNKFWDIDNKQNRLKLINLIEKTKRATITDYYYFDICNIFANGNRFGVED